MKKKPTAPVKTTALVRAVAKKVVADALEDKYSSFLINPLTSLPTYFNAGIASTAEVFPVLPPVAQGTNSNQRIGDKIRPKKLRVDCVITANGSFSSSQMNQVRLFILQDKSIKNLNALFSTPISTQLLDLGGTTDGFKGLPADIMRRVNKQRYNVYADKVFEILSGQGQTPQPVNTYVGNQVFVSGEQCYKVSFVVPTPAVLSYSNSADVWPVNYAPFMCLGYVQPDGNAFPDFLLTRVACNWVSHLDYEDA